jgi:hypothetical protein
MTNSELFKKELEIISENLKRLEQKMDKQHEEQKRFQSSVNKYINGEGGQDGLKITVDRHGQSLSAIKRGLWMIASVVAGLVITLVFDVLKGAK